MTGNKSFLKIGPESAFDLLSLTKEGYEILDCHFSFQQGVDNKGKATTRVHSGMIHLSLSQLPRKDLIEWGLEARKYHEGVIILLDHQNKPVEKIHFDNAACVTLDLDYTQRGDSYFFTKMTIQAENITVGACGIDFTNEWTH